VTSPESDPERRVIRLQPRAPEGQPAGADAQAGSGGVAPGSSAAGLDPPPEAVVADGSPPGVWATLLGLALLIGLDRFLALGTWSLWVDEAHTLNDALALSEGLRPSSPLGYWITAAVVSWSDGATDEATLRLAPALFGWLALPLLFAVFAPRVGRARAALATLLLAVSPWHLYWSQTARGYTLALLIMLLGAGLFASGILRGRRRSVLAGFLVGGLALFAHASAALGLGAWLAAPFLARLARARFPRRPPYLLLVGIAAAVALGMSPWAERVWRTYAHVKGVGNPQHFLLTTGYYFGPFVLAAAAWGGWRGLRSRSAPDLLVASIALLGGAAGLAAAFQVRMSAQYAYTLLPWVAVLATGAAVRAAPTPGTWGGLRRGVVLLLVLPGLVESGLYFGPRRGDRPAWKEAYAYVWNQRGERDLVTGMAAPVGEYYLSPRKRHLRSQRALVRLNGFTYLVPTEWARQERRVWFVVRLEDLHGWPPEAAASFRKLLGEQCREVARFERPFTPRDLTVVVYLRE
jgi:hypothetical protein